MTNCIIVGAFGRADGWIWIDGRGTRCIYLSFSSNQLSTITHIYRKRIPGPFRGTRRRLTPAEPHFTFAHRHSSQTPLQMTESHLLEPIVPSASPRKPVRTYQWGKQQEPRPSIRAVCPNQSSAVSQQASSRSASESTSQERGPLETSTVGYPSSAGGSVTGLAVLAFLGV